MPNTEPFFSVVIPAYNAERFIGLTLESVFRQTFQDLEVVVVNDGSTDGTLSTLEGIDDKRLRIVTQPNGGECAARNRGIREARGKYIALLDADDAWRPNHLEIMHARIQRHEGISWFVTPVQKVAEILEEDLTMAEDRGCDITNWYLDAHIIPASSSTVIERELACSIPDLFPPGFKMFGDAIGWAKLAKKHNKVAVVNANTVLYRFWQGNASTMHNVYSHGMRTEAVKAALAKHVELYREPDCPPEAKLYYRLFALGDWRACITSSGQPEEWQEDFAARKDLVGRGATFWMHLWAKVGKLSLCAMRWGMRRRRQAIERKMLKLAKKTSIHFN